MEVATPGNHFLFQRLRGSGDLGTLRGLSVREHGKRSQQGEGQGGDGATGHVKFPKMANTDSSA